MTQPLIASAVTEIGSLLFLLAGLLAFAFWLWMLIDCIRFETDGSSKVAWLLVILLVGAIGAPLYFFIRKMGRAKTAAYQPDAPVYQPWKKDQRIG